MGTEHWNSVNAAAVTTLLDVTVELYGAFKDVTDICSLGYILTFKMPKSCI